MPGYCLMVNFSIVLCYFFIMLRSCLGMPGGDMILVFLLITAAIIHFILLLILTTFPFFKKDFFLPSLKGLALGFIVCYIIFDRINLHYSDHAVPHMDSSTYERNDPKK